MRRHQLESNRVIFDFDPVESIDVRERERGAPEVYCPTCRTTWTFDDRESGGRL